jgi:hypothetical protein
MTTRLAETARQLPAAADLLPWFAHEITIRPFGPEWWAFNPSIHYDADQERWRCMFRLANYSLPDGIPRLSTEAQRGRADSRCVLADLDPTELSVSRIHWVRELDDLPRAATCGSRGLEDLRLFRTARDGVMGVATALQYNLERPSCPEIVLCWLDDADDVVEVRPLRGSWSALPQKNWAPYDGTTKPRLIYSIERGIVMSDAGALIGSPCEATPRPTVPVIAPSRSAAEVRIVGSTRSSVNATPVVPARPGSSELRGGSQLLEVAPDRWLGIAHECKLQQPDRRKYYWHTFYVVDGNGRLIERSPAIKLSPATGIEFAAGMAIDRRGTLAVSYGVDDETSWVGVTQLSAVLDLLRPV